MSEQENLAVVRAWVEAINRNDVDAELACWAGDGEFVVVPTGSTCRGAEQIRHAGQQSASVVGGQPVQGRKQITHLEAGDQWACVTYVTRSTIRGPVVLDGVTVVPAGADRSVETRACAVFDMRHGKIRRATEYFDSLAMAKQLGLDPATLDRLYSSLGSTTRPADVVAEFFRAWNAKDLDGLMALVAPQVSGCNPLTPGEVTLSKDAVRNAIERNMAEFPDLKMEIKTIISTGGQVAVEEIETATLAATGRSYTMPVGCFLQVDPSGQITHIHNYWDTRSYFGQLDITPEGKDAL